MSKSPMGGLTAPAVVLLLAGCAVGGAPDGVPYTGPHLSPTECRDLAALRTNAHPKVVIVAIDQDRVYFQAKGYVSCELQWGSNSDLRNDMGATAEESFPFVCRLSSSVDEPSDVEADDDGLSVDTSSWHDRMYDEDHD
jgi:hypothetical protein